MGSTPASTRKELDAQCDDFRARVHAELNGIFNRYNQQWDDRMGKHMLAEMQKVLARRQRDKETQMLSFTVDRGTANPNEFQVQLKLSNNSTSAIFFTAKRQD